MEDDFKAGAKVATRDRAPTKEYQLQTLEFRQT